MTFGDFFDLREFNKLSVEEGKPPLVPWRTFMENAPRETIVARIHNDFNCHKYKEPFFELVEEEQSGGCYASKWLHNPQLEEADFCAVRVVLLWGCLSRPDAIGKMRSVLFGGWRPEQVTLVLRMWAANWNRLQRPWAASAATCRDTDGANMQHRLRPSPRLLSEAQYYTSAFLNSRNRVAVMIRSEQAIRGFSKDSGDRIESLKVCLQRSAQLARSLLWANKTASEGDGAPGIYLTLDVGSYGSNSLDWVLGLEKYNLTHRGSEVITTVRDFVPLVYEGKWSFADWENSFVKAVEETSNPGYIASLQRTIASQSDCLVLMGGGDYQRLAMVNYLENHPEPAQLCLYLVCFTTAYETQFSNLVKEAYNVTSLNSTLHLHVVN